MSRAFDTLQVLSSILGKETALKFTKNAKIFQFFISHLSCFVFSILAQTFEYQENIDLR